MAGRLFWCSLWWFESISGNFTKKATPKSSFFISNNPTQSVVSSQSEAAHEVIHLGQLTKQKSYSNG